MAKRKCGLSRFKRSLASTEEKYRLSSFLRRNPKLGDMSFPGRAMVLSLTMGYPLHFRHRYTFDLFKRLLGNNLIGHRRNVRIYYSGRYSRYPFQADLHGLPSSVIKECLLGFIQPLKNNQVKEKKNYNFLDWVSQTFGKGLAKHFMIPYYFLTQCN